MVDDWAPRSREQKPMKKQLEKSTRGKADGVVGELRMSCIWFSLRTPLYRRHLYLESNLYNDMDQPCPHVQL